jgi:hypothetical protein
MFGGFTYFIGVEGYHPPSGFVVVAGDWPGSLISLLALDLPIQGALLSQMIPRVF